MTLVAAGMGLDYHCCFEVSGMHQIQASIGGLILQVSSSGRVSHIDVTLTSRQQKFITLLFYYESNICRFINGNPKMIQPLEMKLSFLGD